MRRTWITTAATCFTLSLAAGAQAATLKVGPNETYTKPCDAIAAAQPNDVVEVAAGTYTDTCPIATKGLTVRGVGGRPKIDLSGTDHPAFYKGIYVVTADDVRIENLELMGAHISSANGSNGAALRVEGRGLVVHGCVIHDNQNGILATPATPGGTITIEYTELAHNGLGDGCTTSGCTHNVYVNHFDKLIFQYNWTHDIADDLQSKGHLLKSRAAETDVLYNRVTGENGRDSYAVNLPNGGLGIVVGNMIEKGPNGDNQILIAYGEEGLSNPDKRLFVVNNTLVNNLGKGTFINVASGGVLTAHNNLFVGVGTPVSGGTLSPDNLVGIDPLFVDAAKFDYHLQAGSPARGKGVDPGAVDGRSLTPTFEYVQPTQGGPRATHAALDVGAFEFGPGVAKPDAGAGADGGGDAGSATGPDGGVSTAPDAGGGPQGGDGGAPNGATGSSGGCAIDPVPGAGAGASFLVGLVGLAAALARGRRRAPR